MYNIKNSFGGVWRIHIDKFVQERHNVSALAMK